MLKALVDSDDVGEVEEVEEEVLRDEEVFILKTGKRPRIHRDGANQIARSCPRAINVVDVAIALEA